MHGSGQDRIERHLAAILAADVAGYSRLTGEDEEGTHVQLQAICARLSIPRLPNTVAGLSRTPGTGS
jgi:adenylate cyclase